jgi:predicted dinucleotide-binding enzyme
MKKQKYPPGWNEKRVRKVIAHYANQTEAEQAAEIEAAIKADNITLVAVPTPLVPEVLSVIRSRKRTA